MEEEGLEEMREEGQEMAGGGGCLPDPGEKPAKAREEVSLAQSKSGQDASVAEEGGGGSR